VTSCRTGGPQSSDIREFQPLAVSASLAADDVVLSGAGDAVYRSYRDTYDSGRGIENQHLRIEFPKLTVGQFHKLHQAYGFGLSQVSYNPYVVYALEDFLTPMMQAVINFRFRDEINSNYSHLTSNCWSTAYEVLRSAAINDKVFSVFLQAEPAPILRAFQVATSRPLLKANSLSALALYPDLKFGDLVLQFDPNGELEHAVIVVDRDIYFEKTAVITESPYRLVHAKDWAYPVQPGGALELWRIDATHLQNPAALFKSAGLTFTGANAAKVQFPLLEAKVSIHFDQLGRARLDDAALHPLVSDKPVGY
jgi:hypothetical protein